MVNFDKANRINIDQTTVSNNNTTVTPKPQGIGVVPVGKVAEEDNPITQLINSEQFKALPKEEQLAELKKQFPNVDESQLNALLSTPKKEAPEVTDEGVAKTEPEVTDEGTKPEVTVPEGEDKTVPAEQADMKALAQVGAQLGIKNPTVDDLKVIYNALSQKAPDELSPAEKKVMEFIAALSSEENRPQQIMKLLADNAQAIDNIIPKEVLQSEEWKSKTPEEKLYARMEIVLDKLDPNFAKIEDPAQKEAYMKGVLGTIAEAMSGGQKMSEAEKDYHISVVAFLADAAEEKGITMSKLVSMMQNKDGKGQEEFLELAINLVDDKGLLKDYFADPDIEDKKGINYLAGIANTIMQSANPEKYAKLSQEDKDRIAARALNIIGKQAYGEMWKQPDDISLKGIQDANRGFIFAFTLRFRAAKEAGHSKLAEVIGTSKDVEFQKKAVQEERDYVAKHNFKIQAWQEMQWQIRETSGEGLVGFNRQVAEARKKAEQDRTPEEKVLVAMHDFGEKYGYSALNYIKDVDIATLQTELENDYNGNIRELALAQNDGDPEKLHAKLTGRGGIGYILQLAMAADIHTEAEMNAFLKDLGLGIDQIDSANLLKELVAIKAGAFGHVYPTSAEGMEAQSTAMKLGRELGKIDFVDDVLNNDVSRCGNDTHKRASFDMVVSFGEEYDAAAGKFLNNKNNTQEFNNTLARETFLRTDLPDSRKESLTSNYLKYAEDDAARVSNARNIYDIDNEGVQRGIVQGESYITDNTYKEQYSEVVTQMINSCSDPQRRESLTQYRQEVQANAGSSSSSSSSGTKGSKGASGTSGSKGSSGTSGTSTSSNTPKTGASSSNSSAQSAAAQARAQAQQDYAQAVTQALQLRKEEALRKLAQITENYQKSVEEREERKAKEAQKAEEQSSNKDYSSFSAETRKILEESDRVFESADRTLEIAKIDSALTDAEITVPSDKKEELIQAYQSGGATSLYEKLGSVSAKYQEQYLNYFAEHANTSDLCSFAANHVGNKNIILALYQRSNNPALLQYLGESNALDLLNKGKIKLEDFLRYASPNTVARYIQSMKEIGNTDAIKAVVSQLSLKQREETSENIIAEAQNNTPLPGSDEWMRAQQKQMEKASNLGVEPKASAPKRETEKLNLDGSNPRIGAGMLSLNPEEDDFDGLSMGSNRVRMGIDIKKRDKRFFRMG